MTDWHFRKSYRSSDHCFATQGRRQGGLRGLQPPTPPKKKEKKRERLERKKERGKKKEKRGIKRERKLNQSFQEHVVMGL